MATESLPDKDLVMVSKPKISVHTRIFMLIMFFTWSLALVFFALQYSREVEFKTEVLDSRLQMLNVRILNHLEKGGSVTPQFLKEIGANDSRDRGTRSDAFLPQMLDNISIPLQRAIRWWCAPLCPTITRLPTR